MKCFELSFEGSQGLAVVTLVGRLFHARAAITMKSSVTDGITDCRGGEGIHFDTGTSKFIF